MAFTVCARSNWDDSGSIFGYLIQFGSMAAITLASLQQRRREVLASHWSPGFLATMAQLILAVSLDGYGLMWLLLARIDAMRVASLFYLGPPGTMLMTWIAFWGHLFATDITGLVIAVAGVVLAQGVHQRLS
ncbi:hypothetical protein TspCOW1_06470 [Thiohalobacter sp. COW1]|uniref:Permeases of the drug/metabolite transporter n=1 Tax=Thiohalobacter thiocyanaticus TaxID=585455 RepID=A0A1Z4VRX7_9GAMM|nr:MULTISPECIES: hypothetical protein [Thiohalobacter]BAZ94387.1 permeases of the drug/metabolite transporter [Thiohalobacter thiocyanaticus]BCO30544.1 hypothetical protein TspCOW1_06470 [Thiohalobacter sp. COW1]